MIGNYNKIQLERLDSFKINKRLDEEEIENLSYLNNEVELLLLFDDVENIKKILQKIKELNKNIKVGILISEKNKIIDIINSCSKENIFLLTNFYKRISIEKYLKLEEILEKLILPAKKFTSFEKYIYAYDIAKNYKAYKEDSNDNRNSRDLYCILESDSMVCTGFSLLFGNLLEKLEIPNIYFESVLSSRKKDTKIYHARRYSYIYDPKYEIDGFYIADPTWDNSNTNNLYNYLALTTKEMEEKEDYEWLIDDAIFYARTKEELVKIIKVLYRNEMINMSLDRFIQEKIFSKIKILDPKKVKELEYIEEDIYCKKTNDEKLSILIEKLGNYFIELTNPKEISKEKINNALSIIYLNNDIDIKNKSLIIK